MAQKSVVLFSGGLDSTTLLAMRSAEADEVIAVSFNYGSKHNLAESQAAQRITNTMGIERIVVDLDFNRWGFKSDLLTSGGEIPEGHYAEESMKSTVVPFRNGIMLSIAVGIAESREADKVWIASHAGDHPVYPDCRPEFTEAMNAASMFGTETAIQIQSTFEDIGKHDIVGIAADNEALPLLALSWSCYQPQDRADFVGVTPDGGIMQSSRWIHCGRCGTCVERKEAYELAKIEDPTEYVS